MVPGIDDRPGGCLFAPRCRWRTMRCSFERPALRPAMGAKVRCHYPLDDAGKPTGREPIVTVLAAEAVTRHYPVRGGHACSRRWTACRSRWNAGRTLAVVGESGCGKSTLARVCALMEPPTAGADRHRR